MRKMIIGAVAVLALLAVPAAARAATPASSGRMPVPNTSGTLGAVACGFPIDVATVANNEYQVVTMLNGATVVKITGELVLSFKNDSSGKTIEENVSGPSTETFNPDGTGTFLGEGPSWFGFGPVSKMDTGEPGLVFTQGRVSTTFNGNVTETFSLDGTQENGCSLLS